MFNFVWASNAQRANTTLLFALELHLESKSISKIKISAADSYKLYVNGQLSSFGPARSAVGYFRTDEFCTELNVGKNVISALVCSYGVGTYSNALQEPFFWCDVESGGKKHIGAKRSRSVYGLSVARTLGLDKRRFLHSACH